MKSQDKERMLREIETRNWKRSQERQLRRQLNRDIDGGAVSMNADTVDTRYNPDHAAEDWKLGNQLEHGPRLTPHRGR